eukprot:g5054.t1
MDSHLLDSASSAVGVRLAARAAKRALVSSEPHVKRRAVQRKQAGTAVPVADTRERSGAVHYLNFKEYYDDVAEMLLNAKPPIAIKNPDFDPDKPFSEPIIITQPHRVIVGDETSWSQRVEEKGGRASLKIVPYSKSVQAKKEGGARAGAAQSAHSVGTNNGWSDTLMVACNLAGETLSMMWIQQKGTVEAEDEAAALAASFTDSTGAPMTASGKAIGLVLRANSKGGRQCGLASFQPQADVSRARHRDEGQPLIQRAQQAARKAKNLNNLTPAMIRTLEGLLSRMEG